MELAGRFRRLLATLVAIRDSPIDSGWTPALAVGCLALLTAVVFWRQLLGHWTFPWDVLGPYTASPPFVAATFGSGHPLSWSPFVASGFPVDVNPQAGIYFPLWWLFGAVGVPLNLTALTAVQVAHVFLGGLGVLALCRTRGLRWPWATVAAAGYLFFGGFYGEAEHADIVRGFAYLPWLLWSLTPPHSGRAWTRVVLVPPLVWLIATGAYPGQLPAFAILAAVYLVATARQQGAGWWRRERLPLALAAVAGAAACLAVLEPYLTASLHGDLYRAAPATASVRATGSLGPRDLFGLFLNSFAWHQDGSITSWSIAAPLLIGLVLTTREVLRRQLPLVACGAAALVLASAPKIGLIGRAMVALGPLFPSRFPAADYKAAVALALLVLSAEGWAGLATASSRRRFGALTAGVALPVAAALAPSTYAEATTALPLLAIVSVATGLLALTRVRARVLIPVLIALVAIDGAREAHDYLSLGRTSSWNVSPAGAAVYRERDPLIARLGLLLRRAPPTRSARVPAVTPDPNPTGADPDASGWVADGYHLTDYFSAIERVRWRATHDPVWSKLLLQPWHAYVFPCSAAGCPTTRLRLPPPAGWTPSTEVRTLSYGAGTIVYAVRLRRPSVMVENELAIRGWRSSTGRAVVIDAGIPLRAWRLAPGTYRFTARYQEPGRPLQYSALAVALGAWAVLLLTAWRRWTVTAPVEAQRGLQPNGGTPL